MKVEDLENIYIRFDIPEKSNVKGCEFLINPPRLEGGALYDQIVTTKEELTFSDIVEFIFEAGESIFSSSSMEEALVSMTTAVIALAFNTASISLFPDEYKTILDFIKETKKGHALDSSKLKELIQKDNTTALVLEKLMEKKLLRKNSKGEYIVRKKILTNSNISFIQIAD